MIRRVFDVEAIVAENPRLPNTPLVIPLGRDYDLKNSADEKKLTARA